MTQLARLLNHLETRGPITQLEAFNALGICRLSERCRELSALGYVLEHKLIEVPTREGKVAHVMRYRLLKPGAA